MSEAPGANTILCINYTHYLPWELGAVWDPALGTLDSVYTLGCVSQPQRFPEILPWVFIPWQTGLAVGAACLLLVWWRLSSPGLMAILLASVQQALIHLISALKG